MDVNSEARAEGAGGDGSAGGGGPTEPARGLISRKFPPKKERPLLRAVDARCTDLASYFYPDLSPELLHPLAQQFQCAAEEYERELCRCQLSTCGALFLKVHHIGAPRRQYCCREHAIEGDREQARTRMSNSRRAAR